MRNRRKESIFHTSRFFGLTEKAQTVFRNAFQFLLSAFLVGDIEQKHEKTFRPLDVPALVGNQRTEVVMALTLHQTGFEIDQVAMKSFDEMVTERIVSGIAYDLPQPFADDS